MAYLAKDAANTLFGYLGLDSTEVSYIDHTNSRGFLYDTDSGEKCVVFIYPISHKTDDSKNFFDTRDSGARERGIAWNYAIEHGMKYFCLAVHDQIERYNNYTLSLECNEKRIAEVAGTVNGIRNGKGTQVVIPNDYFPTKNFDRILTKNNFYISAIRREFLSDYLDKYDNRPYMVAMEFSEEEINITKISEKLMNLENKEFIFACLNLMEEHKLFTIDNLTLIEDKEKCAKMFRHNNFHGILFAVDPDKSADEQSKDSTGNSRYYTDKYVIDDKEYYVSSQWEPNRQDARKPLINWIISQLQSVKYNTGYESDFSRNRIIFGAPGTGKSFKINLDKDTLLKNGGEYERVTFHPDYSYANFVGTYKPVPYKDDDRKDAITYAYVPGPFMRTYVKALKNSRMAEPEPYLLIIEEINRANVAAVFGDVFQLLDRDKNISEYPIRSSEDIKKYLAKPENLGGTPEDYNEITIPDNMFIWATMNSADQGVFPMDTAFKRRWDFTYLGIDDSEKNLIGKTVKLGKKPYEQQIEWNELRNAINKFLSDKGINEDKQLGPYFIAKKIAVPEVGDEIDSKQFIDTFKNKVIMYLFEDAAKQKRSILFEGCIRNTNRYSEICKEFDTKGVGIFCKDIINAIKIVDLPISEKLIEDTSAEEVKE